MSRVLFAQQIYFPFQSVARLSASLKQRGHEVDLVIGNESKIVDHAKKSQPDVIAFSVLTPYRNHMLSSVDLIKKEGLSAIVIAGGYDISFCPQVLKKSRLDIICRGEGERALGDLCDRIDSGEDYTDIDNLWVKKGERIYENSIRAWTKNLDEFPFDDREIYLRYDDYFRIFPLTQILAGRGCPYYCSYCFNHKYRLVSKDDEGLGYCRFRSVENVMEELNILKNKYNAKYIVFNDSTLTYNKKWFMAFMEKYNRLIQIPYSLNSVISEVDDDIGRIIGESNNCKVLKFGLETGNEQFRRKVLKKKVTNGQLISGANILKKYNVRYCIATMYGLPGETMELVLETMRMAKKISGKRTSYGVNIFQPYYGLDMTEYGIKIGSYGIEKGIQNKSSLTNEETMDNSHKLAGSGRNSVEIIDSGDPASSFFASHYNNREGEYIVKFAKFGQIAIRFPSLIPLIKLIARLPDNTVFSLIYKLTYILLPARVTGNIPWSFFLKCFLFHRGKRQMM